MLKWFKIGLMLISLAAGFTQLNAAYLILTGKLAMLGAGGRTVQEAARGGVIIPVVVGFLLFFWPVYVMVQERRWKK